MNNWNRSKWGWYFSADKGAGSGTEAEDSQEQNAGDEAETDQGATDEKAEGEDADADKDDADDKKEGDEEATPADKIRELTDDEIAERAAALGFVKPEEKKTEPEEKPEAKGLDIPDFRGKAADAVMADPNAKAKGWVDEDGDLTPLGSSVAENYAMKLSSEDTLRVANEQQEIRDLQASRPQRAETNTKFLQEQFGFEEGEAKSVGKTMTDILIDSYGTAAFKGETKEEQELSKRLWSTAFYTALGIEVYNQRKAASEGGDKGDKPVEKPKGGSGGGDPLMKDLSKEDRAWIEGAYTQKMRAVKGPDYKLTKEDIEKAKEIINR